MSTTPADGRGDLDFTADEIKVAKLAARYAIEAAIDRNPAGMVWFGGHLRNLVGERRARSLLGQYADQIYKTRAKQGR